MYFLSSLGVRLIDFRLLEPQTSLDKVVREEELFESQQQELLISASTNLKKLLLAQKAVFNIVIMLHFLSIQYLLLYKILKTLPL
ncbi:hypothetical protein L873DRAFT_1492875 [Choiromyces venosus 120613-1]|uniref:Uncharacterized protein n=1 Tax=Choiromyces venosus 120613-1 TaxID=1336337 RepID=A0A3N4J6R6_9PEZI|nr:hypothetical protein L873DRAFT_1492875 [Choiromyces venosus 120613-1]